jgi:hypothetical protein
MQVKMIGDTGSRSSAHIPSHIKSLSFDDLLKKTLGIARQIHEFYFLVVGQFRQPRDHTVGYNHQVTRGVRIKVHHQKSGFPPADYQMVRIVCSLCGFAQKV